MDWLSNLLANYHNHLAYEGSLVSESFCRVTKSDANLSDRIKGGVTGVLYSLIFRLERIVTVPFLILTNIGYVATLPFNRAITTKDLPTTYKISRVVQEQKLHPLKEGFKMISWTIATAIVEPSLIQQKPFHPIDTLATEKQKQYAQECWEALTWVIANSLDIKSNFKKERLNSEIQSKEVSNFLERFLYLEKSSKQKDIVHQFIRENLPVMQAYLKEKHKEMLSKQDSTLQDVEAWKTIKNQMKILLLYLVHTNDQNNKKQILQNYSNYTKNYFGNNNYAIDWNLRLPNYFIQILYPDLCKLNRKEQQKFYNVFNVVIDFSLTCVFFRHDYLVRFSKKIDGILSEKFPNSTILDSKTRELLKLKWVHGTSSTTLYRLVNSDLNLMPTGMLTQNNQIPFSGELYKGAGVGAGAGVNEKYLSGVPLETMEVGWRYYATRYHFNIEEERDHLLTDFRKLDISQFSDLGRAQELTRYSFAIRRLKAWDPSEFSNKYENSIKEQVQKIKKQVEELKQGNERSGFENEGGKKFLEIFNSSLKQIEDALDAKIEPLSEEERVFMINPYPILLGTTSALAQPVDVWQNSQEYVVKGALKLGSDISYIFTTPENIVDAEAYIKQQNLVGKVEVVSIEALKQAVELKKAISTYLADLISIKKIEKLSN